MPQQKKRKNKVNATGRNQHETEQYLRIMYNMLRSPQFRSLGGNDVRVLLEIASRHNGFNNGRIGAGLEDLADTLMMGKSTVQRSLNYLRQTKFLKLRKPGMFSGRIASEWEVTFLKADGVEPSNEWGQSQSRSYKRKPKGETLLQQSHQEIELRRSENHEAGT